MADNLLRLKVDSQEYDAKLKKAAEGVRHLADVAHKSAGDMTGLEKSTLDYIKSIGEMETKSRSAAGQVRELESTYKELKVIYDQLNDVEKADEGGKALAKSLEQLKQRAQDAKKSLDDASKSLNDNEDASKKDSNSISDLTSKLGINIKSLVGWGAALGAAKMALDVMKDALFQSENNVDEWGRTIAASESVYTGFLNALNSGDFSGFLNNLSNIVSSAKEAYNALDELGTRMTIINPERAKLQARQQELRATIRTKGADSAEGKAAQKELQNMQSQITASYGKESQMNKNAFEALVRQRLQEGGINLTGKSFDQFMKTFSDDNAFQQLRRGAKGSIGYQNYVGASKKVDNRNTNQKLLDLFTDEWRQQNISYLTAAYNAQGAAASNALGNARYNRVKTTGGKTGKSGKQDIQFADDSIMAQEKLVQDLTKKWKTVSGELRDGYLKQLEDAKQKLAEMYGNKATMQMETGLSGFNEQTISAWTSMMKSKISKAELGSDLYNSLTQNVSDMNTLTTAVQDAMKLGLKIPQEDVQEMFDTIFNRGTLPEDLYAGMIQKFIDEFKERTGKDLQVGENGSLTVGTDKGKDKKQDTITKQLDKFNGDFSKMTSGVSGILSGIQQMGIEIPKEIQNVIGVLSGVSSILSGITTLLALIQIDTKVTAATNTVKTVPVIGWALANGGIVPKAAGGRFIGGNSMSGDNIFAGNAWVNSGELVLNRAQQGNLASQLEGGSMQNLNIDWVLTGDKLRAVMNNNGRRTGRGELVQRNRI